MPSQVFFNGVLWTTPTAMSAVNDSANAPVNPQTGNALVILGQAAGGKPGVAVAFDNPTDALNNFVSGDLAYMVPKAFSASDELNGPGTVYGMRVGEATQGTVTLLDGAGHAALLFTTTQYGLPASGTAIQIATGSVSGLAVSVKQGQILCSQDNVGRTPFSVHYTGAQASAQITVTDTNVILYAPAGTVVATIDLTVYTQVQNVVDRINSTAGFTAALIGGSEFTVTLNGLDNIAAQDVKTAPFTVTANLQAVIDWLNSPANTLGTASRPAGAGLPPAVVGWTYVIGATYTPPIIGDWTAALSALQTVDVQWIAVLSSDPAVAAALDAHVQFMSKQGKKERRGFTGPALGTPASGVPALAFALNSDRTAMAWPGFYDYDQNGNLTLFPPYFTGAVVAAGFAGSSPGTPMTNKTFTLRGLEVPVRNPVDTDALIEGGVLAMESTTEGFKCVRSISTWLANNNFNRVEVSCGAATDYAVRTVRDALQTLVGQEGSPIAIAKAVQIAESTLTQLAIPAPAGPGVIVGDANSPAFKNITATLEGDVLSVSWQMSPVIPINFIPCSVSIVPYSGTASA